MPLSSPHRGLPRAFTLFDKLLALPERLRAMCHLQKFCPLRPTRLALEAMEERLVPEGRPLPLPVIFAGAGMGHSPVVKAYDAETGDLKFALSAYAPTFQGGVRVGTGDFTGDGIPDVVTAPGPDHTPVIKVFDGTTGDQITGPLGGFLAYAPSVTGGVYVSAADVDGDHTPDVVTSAVTAVGPRVKVFSGATGDMIADFFVSGMSSTNGLTVAAADLTGDAKAEVVLGSGLGGDGWVRTYDPLTRSVVSGPLGNFRAFGTSYGSGVYTGSDALAADVDSDGTLDLAVGTRGSVQSRVRVFSGATGAVLHDFLPFGSGVTGGARVALAYVTDDPYADVVVGSGPGNTAEVRVFDGVTGDQLAAPLGQYSPFGLSPVGVFVAASNDPLTPNFISLFPPSPAVVGQVVRVSITVVGQQSPPVQPTGTITLKAGPSITIGTLPVVPDGTGYRATAVFDFGSLQAGSYVLNASYSGDANYNGSFAGSSFLMVSVPSSTAPTDQPVGDSCPAGPVQTPVGGAGAAAPGVSAAGVNYRTGAVQVNRSDLSSGGYGAPWGQDWGWTNATGYPDGVAGSGATQSQAPHLVQVSGNNSLAMVSNAQTARFFDLYGGAYHTRHGDTAVLTQPTGEFAVTDGTGQVFTFYDFSGGTPAGRAGKLKKVTDAAGNITEVTSWDSGGRPTEAQRVSGTGGSALTESFLSTYIASGTNAGLLETVTQRTRVGTGSWSTVRSTAYTYYDGTSGPGLAGALKTAVVKDAGGNAIDTNYYRYYTSGAGTSGNMKYAFGADAYRRLTAAKGTGLDSLTDGDVDEFADKYLEYDTSGRVTKAVDAAAGCSVCSGGQGEFTYTYWTNSSATLRLYNAWANRTVETLPDLSTNTVYTNAFGQVMLTVFDDAATTGNWYHYTRYDDAGRVVLEAGPSVVTGFSESNADLVGYSGGNAFYLDDVAGLVTAYTYANSTTATTSTPGDAAGFLKQVNIKHGETGTQLGVTLIPQLATTYIKRTAGGQDFFFTATSTVYRNDNGTGGQTISASYTWQGSTAEIQSVTTTLPTVTTDQNGSNSATTMTTFADGFGRPVWSKDQAGSISYTQYDTVTGAVIKTIADVDTDLSSDFASLPSGWGSPNGLHLITNYEVDSLGRLTKATSPESRIDYTVYDDIVSDGDPQEVRTYSGWNTTTNTPTGPTRVSRYDTAGGYTETLTMSATPSVTSGRPTGTESIDKVQSLSRSYTNAVGQVTHSDVYFDLSGLPYTTSISFGTEGTNFYRTEYRYDNTGQLNRTETHLGTITRTVHDGQGRAVSEWIGTDDTPTSGFWSPTNTDGTNLVKVRDFEYDGGGVGDGNMTKVTEYPEYPVTTIPKRVTQTWYDWRNRGVATKLGMEGSESTSVNRPLVYNDLDNLGQVTKTRVYDADGTGPTTSNGQVLPPPDPNTSTPQHELLRAQSTSAYDELGRAYRTETYSVNPIDGTVGSNTLKSDAWFDARGLVIKTKSPGGLVQKMAYDGVGRATITYVTDGGSDSGYSDADDVTGDTVLEQSEATYSNDGLVLSTVNRMRFHDATGTGALGSPTTGVGARVSYAGYYYDTYSGRLTAAVNVGTNGGTAWTRPGTVPSRSDTVLVTSCSYAADAVQTVKLTGSPTGGTFTLTFGGQTTSGIAYNASSATVDAALEALSSIGSSNVVVSAAVGGGWQVRFAGTLAGKYQSKMTGSGAGLTGGSSPSVAISTVSAGGDTGRVFETTDPKDLKTRSYADALGRTTQSIENFVDGEVSDGDDKTTAYTYNAAGMTSLTALLAGGGFQTTEWVFGVTQAGGNKFDSNDIVGASKWSDPTTGAASSSEQKTTTVNALGQILTATDRNGNVHTLNYDVLGRITSDAVTTLGSGVDGSVRRIEYGYDGQGNAYLVTSYDAASGGNIVNQVQREFNGLGQMTKEYQSHSGAVNTGTSPRVQYAYSEMAAGANHSRLTSMTYPSGYVLTFNYSSGLNSDISRLSSLSDSSGTVESYDYLGLGAVARRGHSQPGVDLTYIKQSGESNGEAGDQYTGLDRFGRVVDQRWIKTTTGAATDRLKYGYDRNSNRLWRDNLVNTAFGELYAYDNLNQLMSFDRGTLNGTKTGLTGSASRAQDWDYDALGNWDSLTTDGGSPQTRTANAQNEITSISGATTPTYDANGNMTRAETGLRYVYDAWNRLVAVKDSPGTTTLKTYGYDGLHSRLTETASGTTTDLYYSDQWQVLEEKIGSNTAKRYVWSPVYVDAMILRDRDTDGNGSLDERLWVQQDANFNVTALVDGSGNVVERYAYDPFGVVTIYSPDYSTVRSSSLYIVTYLWQGRPYDSISATYNFRNREVSPALGRPIQLDMLGFAAGDVNFYRWETNGPVSFVDPSGHVPRPFTWSSPDPRNQFRWDPLDNQTTGDIGPVVAAGVGIWGRPPLDRDEQDRCFQLMDWLMHLGRSIANRAEVDITMGKLSIARLEAGGWNDRQSAIEYFQHLWRTAQEIRLFQTLMKLYADKCSCPEKDRKELFDRFSRPFANVSKRWFEQEEAVHIALRRAFTNWASTQPRALSIEERKARGETFVGERVGPSINLEKQWREEEARWYAFFHGVPPPNYHKDNSVRIIWGERDPYEPPVRPGRIPIRR